MKNSFPSPSVDSGSLPSCFPRFREGKITSGHPFTPSHAIPFGLRKKSIPSLKSLLALFLLPFVAPAAETRTALIPVTLSGRVLSSGKTTSRLFANYSGRAGSDSIRGKETGKGLTRRALGVYRVVSIATIGSNGATQRRVKRLRVRLSRRRLATAYGTVKLRRSVNPRVHSQRLRGRSVLRVPVAAAGDNGVEPWISDGSNAGTRLLRDINPIGDSNPREFEEMGGMVFFSADDGSHGRELWVSDGTSAGTRLLKDIQPGSPGSAPQNLAAIDGILYFSANNGTDGAELWRSDGTSDGTFRLKDLLTGPDSSNPRTFRKVNDVIIFWAYDGNQWNLWHTDGTEGGTVFLSALKLPANADHMHLLGGEILFTVWTESTHEFWKTDGTAQGTSQIRSGNFYARNFVTLPSGTYFTRPNVGTSEIWRTDGTSGGTELIRSFSNANLYSMGGLSDRLYFGIEDEGDNSYDLWSSDGTSGGTSELHPVLPGFSIIYDFVTLGNAVFFRVNDTTNQYELWKSDGSEQGTGLLVDIGAPGYSADVDELTLVGANLFFSAKDAEGDRELWSTDGSAAGTRKVGTIISGSGNPDVRNIAPFGTGVVFSANDSGMLAPGN